MTKAHDLEVADPDWHADLAEWTAQRDKPFTLAEAMCSALGFQDPLRITRDEQRRAAACLRILGYHRRNSERRGNQLTYLLEWLWHPVEPQHTRRPMEHHAASGPDH